jgi:hypothetical protein
VAQPPPGIDQNELNIAARRVLLDALEALAQHRDALVLVGAQAVYQHTGDAQLGVAAHTSDADLGLDPRKIGAQPLIESAMRAVDFTQEHPRRSKNPGIWWKRQIVGGQEVTIEVDLLVPTEMSEGGRRSVTLPPHSRNSMLRVSGIGLAMEDNEVRAIASLDPTDDRLVDARVAGIAALLIAKAYKLGERANDAARDRLVNKDASDVIGLMLASDPLEVGETWPVSSSRGTPPSRRARDWCTWTNSSGHRPRWVSTSRSKRSTASGTPTRSAVSHRPTSPLCRPNCAGLTQHPEVFRSL